MNILITYATNSGSTFLVADHISQVLQQHQHQITLKNVNDIVPNSLIEYDLVFLGSNSWDFERKEGQPHHAFMKFVDEAKEISLQNHRYVLFGCGDKSYQYFCGALDVIADFVKNHGGLLVHEPLRINQFYFHDADEIYRQVDEWLTQVEQNF